MIEDKKLGLKIAENADEEFWIKAKKQVEDSIFNHKKQIEIDEKVLELCNERLSKYGDRKV
jgi:hypothetical protein